MVCIHRSAIVGLDGSYCPDCRKHFPPAVAETQAKTYDSTRGAVLAEPKSWRSVRMYRSHGRLYYRFAWGSGHTIKGDRHIPGGSVDSPIAAARAEQVKRWISQGVASEKIEEMIQRWL